MNFTDIFKQAGKIQEQMKNAKEKLDKIECEGISGGGLVKVIINGDGSMKKIEIDSTIIVDTEKEIIEDLIVAAFNDSKAKLNNEISKQMNDITGGLPLPPGFNLGS